MIPATVFARYVFRLFEQFHPKMFHVTHRRAAQANDISPILICLVVIVLDPGDSAEWEILSGEQRK